MKQQPRGEEKQRKEMGNQAGLISMRETGFLPLLSLLALCFDAGVMDLTSCAPSERTRFFIGLRKASPWEPVGLWSRFRPEGPWKPSPGFSLGGVTINATSPEGAEEIVI